jgi:hypothetical protein
MIAAAQAAHPTLSVRQLCQLCGVGRTWYYGHPTADALACRDVALRDAIERTVLAFPGYGYRRVTHALTREGWTVNHKRVLRIMRQESLLCQLRRRLRGDDRLHPWTPPLPQSPAGTGRRAARSSLGGR